MLIIALVTTRLGSYRFANNVITNHFLKTNFFCLNKQKITTAMGRFYISFGNLSAVDLTMLQEFF